MNSTTELTPPGTQKESGMATQRRSSRSDQQQLRRCRVRVERALAGTIALLASDDDSVRRDAILLLYNAGPLAVVQLVDVLESTTDEVLRERAGEALRQLSRVYSTEACAALIGALDGGKSEALRAASNRVERTFGQLVDGD
jgi:hypothetical protein